MKGKVFILTLVATLVTAVAAAVTTPSSAEAAPVPIPATCTNAAGDPVGCTLALVGFAGRGDNLRAIFRLTNTATGAVTNVAIPIGDLVQQQATCTILDLTIQPIDLFLLGLHLHTDTIHLVLTAERGTLLGDLLCGLFFGNPAAGLLNQILRNGGVALA